MNSTYNIWENRYKTGGNSGKGSYNELAEFKAEIINKFIIDNNIETIIELGCGDGNQLAVFNIPSYIGIDISPSAVELCRNKFNTDNTKTFNVYSDYIHKDKVDLTLSLDVIYHILEDNLYKNYMVDLFNFSNKYVIIYSNNCSRHKQGHIYAKKFTDSIKEWFPDWQLKQFIKQKYPKESGADFYIYEKL